MHESIADDFVDRFSALVDGFVVGDGLDPKVTMGPLHNRRSLEYARELVADSVERGAVVAEYGKIADQESFSARHFMRPTIILGLPEDARLMREEQFCAAIPIATYCDINEVIARANDTEFGLGSSVWGTNVETALAIANRLEAGTVFVNARGTTSVNRRAPYGGVKQSGIGRKAALEGVREYCQIRAVTIYEG